MVIMTRKIEIFNDLIKENKSEDNTLNINAFYDITNELIQ